MRKIYTSIDIGTDNVKVITLEYFDGKYNILASSSVKSEGVRQGLIVNASLASNSIKKAIKVVESKLGTKITKVLAIVPSNNVEFDILTGSYEIESEEKIVTGEMAFSCLQDCLKNNLVEDKEIVTIIPIEYKLDKKTKIKNPVGLIGNSLSVKAIATSVPKKNVYSVVGLIENLGLEVVDIAFSSTGDYYSIRTEELNSKVIAMVNIGDEITKVAIFNKGVMINEKILPIGGRNIDTDISFTYKTELDKSKEIKETFAVSNRKYADSDEVYNCTNRLDEKIEINQYRLSEIIESRSINILKNIKKEINNLTNREIGYIMITGGITSMLGFNAIVEELFVKNTTVINLGIIGIRDNKYASSYGLIKYFVEKLELREKQYTMFMDDKIEEMLSTRKKKGTTGVLGKVFEKIFD